MRQGKARVIASEVGGRPESWGAWGCVGRRESWAMGGMAARGMRRHETWGAAGREREAGWEGRE